MASTMITPMHFIILVLAMLENLYDEGAGGTGFTDDKESDQQLEILNKSFIKTFKMGDGDIFDCVNIYKQPALSHPLRKGHKIQMKPTRVPVMDAGKCAYKVKDEEFGMQTQACPSGTVPIRRSSKRDLGKAQVLMKAFSERTRISNPTRYHHERVVSREGATYYGVHAQINIQNPEIEDRGQFSEAIMWLQSGEGGQLNVIQAGIWHLFSDNRTRLVISWTADGGNSTGCYNTLCPGFVQVHRRIAPGYVFPKISTFGEQWEDRYSGNWWLVFGRTYERIGYWPKAIFTGLQSCGDAVGWGGQVYSPSVEANPPMESGHFAQEGFREAAFFNNLQYLDVQFDRIHPLTVIPCHNSYPMAYSTEALEAIVHQQ